MPSTIAHETVASFPWIRENIRMMPETMSVTTAMSIISRYAGAITDIADANFSGSTAVSGRNMRA